MSLSLLADTTWYPVTFDSLLNTTRSVFFWIAVAFLLAVAVGALAAKREKRKAFLTVSLAVGICYACIIGIVLLDLAFAEDGIASLLFYPLLALIVCVAGSGIALCIDPKKPTLIATGCLTAAAAIAVLVCMGIHFTNGGSLDLNGIDSADDVNSLGLYLSAGLAVAALAVAAFFCDRGTGLMTDTKAITFAAACIAMSYALSYLRIVKMPQGGSITIASLVPLMIYAYMFGVRRGVLAGLIYGVLQAFQDMYILHPAQFLLDYPVAFACIGLAGLFANVKALEKLPQVKIALGGIVAGLARFVMHFLSGMFAFGMWAPEGQPVWLYSLSYQAAYVLPDIAIAIAVAVILFSSKSFVKYVNKFHPVPKNARKAEKA